MGKKKGSQRSKSKRKPHSSNQKATTSKNVSKNEQLLEVCKNSGRFNDIPNECLTLIFKKISLGKLVSLRVVSVRWNAVVVSICEKKRSLKIFDVSSSRPVGSWVLHDYLTNYRNLLPLQEIEQMKLKPPGDDDHLQMRAGGNFGSSAYVDFLANLFPNVEQLTISKDRFTPKNNNILSKWANLHTLTLVTSDLVGGFAPKLVEILNSKTELRCLDLLFYWPKENINISPLAPTLARLERFSFKMHDKDIEPIFSLLNPNCTRLQIGKISNVITDYDEIYFKKDKMQESIATNPQLALSLTHLTLTQFKDKHLLAYIFKTFVNLQYLFVKCLDDKDQVSSPMKLGNLLNNEISKQKHLVELRILGIKMNLDYDSNTKPQPAPVPSLKVFYIEYSKYNWGHFEDGAKWCKTIATIFPNLERLIIESPYSPMPSIQHNLHRFGHLSEYKFIDEEAKGEEGEKYYYRPIDGLGNHSGCDPETDSDSGSGSDNSEEEAQDRQADFDLMLEMIKFKFNCMN